MKQEPSFSQIESVEQGNECRTKEPIGKAISGKIQQDSCIGIIKTQAIEDGVQNSWLQVRAKPLP